MSEETAAIVVAEETKPEVNESPVHLVAITPAQMESSQKYMSQWLTQKVREESFELEDVTKSAAVAKKNKWNHSSLDRQVVRCRQRLTFYEKILAAVNAGFTIVPNFPVDIFAVRVDRSHPRYQYKSRSGLKGSWIGQPSQDIADEQPQQLPVGDGNYVNPNQLVRSSEAEYTDDKGKACIQKWSQTSDFQDIVFPLAAARPEVMTATQEAMAMRIFDSVGICPQPRRTKGDPLIIAKVFGPKSGYGGSSQKECSFLIAWHLDLRTL